MKSGIPNDSNDDGNHAYMSRVCITAGSKDETPVRIRTSGDDADRADWKRERLERETRKNMRISMIGVECMIPKLFSEFAYPVQFYAITESGNLDYL